MKVSKRYYVYVLLDHTGTQRWIGAGCGNRHRESTRDTVGNPQKAAFIKETMEKLGYIPSVILYGGLTREESFDKEIELIAKIGRMPNGPLTNIYPGGKGFYEGQIYPPQRNAKVSASNKGRIVPQDRRDRISAKLTGRKLSQDHKEKIAVGGRGRKHSDETKAKMSAKQKGRVKSPTELANLRAAVARRPSKKGVPTSDAHKIAVSIGAKRSWKNNPAPRAQKGPDGRFIKSQP